MIEAADWNELWKTASLGASWRNRQKDPVMYFDKKAKWYNQTITSRADHIRKILARLAVDHDCSILDIGSGPGPLTIPLAKTTGKVTAVDPSGKMLWYLEENIRNEGLKNVVCINKRWEDIEIGKDIAPHDIVVASHSLAMLDIKEALLKMDQAADQSVYLLASAGKPRDDYLALWPKLYGEKYVPGPNYIFLINILYQIGITANVEIWEHHSRKRITCLDKEVAAQVAYFDSPLPDSEAAIREYIAGKLVKEKETQWMEKSSKTAMIWWTKSTGDKGDANPGIKYDE